MNDTEASQLNILKFDLKEIQNQISHLVRSNKELEDAIKAKEDDEFSLAIKENTVIIDKKRDVVADLKKKITELQGAKNSNSEEELDEEEAVREEKNNLLDNYGEMDTNGGFSL